MGFKEWAKKQEDAKQFGNMLIDTFQGCTEEEMDDVEFVIDTLRNKYGDKRMDWMYSIERSSCQQGWERFNRECMSTREIPVES